jgi:hypothetical protein
MNKGLRSFFNKDDLPVWGLMLLLTVFFVIMALTALGDYGGADTYWHYFITHYAFQRPELFLYHWGKPLFTALSAPFAWFGFFGLQLFNIIVSMLSAWLAWRLCKKLELKFSWLSILLIIFAPIYFMLVFSGLTENLFGLVLILAVFLFFKDKYILAAIVISFIPFSRTEGLIILPLFFMAFVYKRKWLPILFLATGFAFYGIVGYFHYHDFFWLFTKSPYGKGSDVYGTGSLWHFVSRYREIFGFAFTCLILLGAIEFLIPFFRKSKKNSRPVSEILLILLPVLLYFAAHSYVWWKGSLGSAGLTRVIAGIIPLAAVLGVKGFNVLAPLLKNRRILQAIILLPLSAFIIYEPFRFCPIPFPTGFEEKVFDHVTRWIEKEKPIQKKLYVLNPYLVFKLNMNPYDGATVGLNFPPVDDLKTDTHPGDLLVWDAHFGPNEAHVPLDSLMKSKFFILKAVFFTEEIFVNDKGQPFEVYAFQRTDDTAHISNALILEELKENYYDKIPVFSNTFPGGKAYTDSTKTNPCFKISSDMEYSPGMDTLLAECNFGKERNFQISVDFFPLESNPDAYINFVACTSFEKDVYMYNCFHIKYDELTKNKWNHVAFKFVLPEMNNPKERFGVYLWNDKKNQAIIDNLRVDIIVPRKI